MTIENQRTIQLPETLCEQVERRFAAQGRGLESFLVFILRELLRDEATEMDKAEEQVLAQRLKDLGYLR